MLEEHPDDHLNARRRLLTTHTDNTAFEEKKEPLIPHEAFRRPQKNPGICWKGCSWCIRSFSSNCSHGRVAAILFVYSLVLGALSVVMLIENGHIAEVVKDYTDL